MKYVTSLNFGDVKFDVGSDWHLPPDRTDLLASFASRVKQEQGSTVLILAGDLIETSDGLNASPHINSILKDLSKVYKGIIFTPGNHCLRGRENPWSDFSNLSDNVRCAGNPKAQNIFFLSSLDKDLPDACVMLTNIFYDMKFLKPELLGLTNEILMKQYAESNDGQHFLGGKTDSFVQMATNARNCIKALGERIDILVTHALPHPSLVTFRVAEMTPEIQALSETLGVPFICNPEEDVEKAKRWSTTAEGFRAWWNNKSFFMGSDILTGLPFRDNLIAVYGHNHRSNKKPAKIDGKTVHFVSHQPNPWESDYK